MRGREGVVEGKGKKGSVRVREGVVEGKGKKGSVRVREGVVTTLVTMESREQWALLDHK